MDDQLSSQERAKLRKILEQYFDLSELKTLTFDLGINYQQFPNRIQEFNRELILYCERHQQLYSLILEIMRVRPRIDLSDFLSKLAPSPPYKKIQIIIPHTDVDEAKNILDNVFADLGYTSDQVEFIAASWGSIHVLLGLPEPFTIALLQNKDKYFVSGFFQFIDLYSDLDIEIQDEWRNRIESTESLNLIYQFGWTNINTENAIQEKDPISVFSQAIRKAIRKANKKPIRILVVDDHALVRKGLVALLDVKRGVEVVGEASDGDEAVQMARVLQPDVILLDLVMPKKDGITVLKEIRQENKEVKVLILTSFTEESKIKAAIEAGANGFQLKDSTPAELLTSIQVVYQGGFIANSQFSKRITKGINDDKPIQADGDLTERELEILKQIAQGYTNREIADMLSISDRTVSTHVSHILSKMKVDNRVQATMKAVNGGLIVFEENES